MEPIKLNLNEYLELKAMVNIIAKGTRESLQKIFYNTNEKHFAATDGHILRLKNLQNYFPVFEKENEQIKNNFLIDNNQLLNTKSMFISMYGFDGRIKVQIEPENSFKYPDYLGIIANKKVVMVEHIIITLDLLNRFSKTEISGCKIFKFQFTGENSPILVYKYDSPSLEGIIMPYRSEV